MGTLRDFARGVGASFSRPALAALGWVYAACLAVGVAFTILVYRFVASTVSGSAIAAELRQGQSANWVMDLIGEPGTRASLVEMMTAAMVLVPVYLVLALFFSGGVVSKVRAALGLAGPDRFLAASARYVGPMARVAVVEIVVVGILASVLLVGLGAGLYAGASGAVVWTLLGLSTFVLALVTSVFDYARIEVVAADGGSALGALGSAFRFAGRRPVSVVVLALLNTVLALAVAWVLVWLHSLVPLDTGPGVLLGMVVGQAGVLGRLWSRVAAYATETALWENAAER